MVGVSFIFIFVLWSIDRVQTTFDEIAAKPDTGAQQGDSAGDEGGDIHEPPQYLANVVGFSPGSYAILDDPDSYDWDYGLRRGEDHDIPEPDGELKPGIYASSFEGTECGYELVRVMDTQREKVIGSDHLSDGRLLATINEVEPDRFASEAGCGQWQEWSPLVTPLTVASNGDYWIGDLALGHWLVPEGCLWEEVVNFRGALPFDTIGSGWGPDTIVVDESSMGFRVRNCSESILHASAAS